MAPHALNGGASCSPILSPSFPPAKHAPSTVANATQHVAPGDDGDRDHLGILMQGSDMEVTAHARSDLRATDSAPEAVKDSSLADNSNNGLEFLAEIAGDIFPELSAWSGM